MKGTVQLWGARCVAAAAAIAGCGRASAADLDFSSCGYRQSEEAIPPVPVRAVVTPGGDGDDERRIQAAIDFVSALEPGGDGFRGAVLLGEGCFTLAGGLTLRQSGVVLRGAGVGATVLQTADGSRAPMVRVVGAPPSIAEAAVWQITDEAVPSGATRLTLDRPGAVAVGDRVWITRPSTAEWIAALGMNREGIAWKPGTRDLRWERTVVGVEGDTIALDAPITTALERRFGGAWVQRVHWPGRVVGVGVEDLSLRGDGEAGAWCGVTVDNAEDVWVRRVEFAGLPGSAVAVWEGARRVTVRDCASVDPRSEIGGGRRETYFTAGGQTLFLRCWAEEGGHDFALGHAAPGPNAFVGCHAARANGWSGALGSWASGALFDNVTVDGAALRLSNRWRDGGGVGQAAANCEVWQCAAAEFELSNPPGARNRARGTWGTARGEGSFEQQDEFVSPTSLFLGQLSDRIGAEVAAHLGDVGKPHFAVTNPTPDEAARFVAMSDAPALTLKEQIAAVWEASRKGGAVPESAVLNPSPEPVLPRPPTGALSVRDGRFFVGDEALSGGRYTPTWWRGTTRPGEAEAFGPAITRFVPGRIGRGFTDELAAVAEELVGRGYAVVEHHHGLWYDRRRDDHLRERRSDGAVLPPFYEQPYARSGEGRAWDGLSRYDLMRPNPWYWRRLSEFAGHCESFGLVLLNQHYFQHNLLEAGAHWADYPWRSANNVNDPGFPEPPPYVSDKRIFQAHLFYDVEHPRRRALHRATIRQNLAALAGSPNVVHSLGAEFTGPLEFVQFWIDTCAAWERETGRDALLALSCTKDVQDAVLDDPARAGAISVIDIRQWWYTAGGDLYAPPGGVWFAPRQHARRLRPERPDAESRRRAVEEYRQRHPDKVVLFDGAPLAGG